MNIPILGISGYSGSGKTTLIEKLIPLLRAKGLRLAVVKHDGHRIEIDKEGKDSWRFSKAGAEMVILTSAEKTAVIEQRALSLEGSLHFIHDVDLVLVEGYKNANITQIGIARKENGKGFTREPKDFWRVITDIELLDPGIPCCHLEDVQGLADDIFNYRHQFSYFSTVSILHGK